jgi:thiamine-phosphate diphosphorylase/hydroxyethylthiazole kinase
VVEQAIAGGATIIQLREKNASTRAFVDLAQRVKRITSTQNVRLIINDRVDVALAVDADGVHIGEDDMPIDLARRILGPNKIIGITVSTPEAAAVAVAQGADYLGTDAIFPTTTKTDKTAIGVETFSKITKATSLPVVAIGGINASNIQQVMEAGAAGIAVVSAIVTADDVCQAACSLVQLVNKYVSKTGDAPQQQLSSQTLQGRIGAILQVVKDKKALIHHITNLVVTNLTANATLAVGASPVMAHAQEEVADMVKHAGALVLNMGTLDQNWVASAHLAAKTASKLNIPVVFDPVGAGATPYRSKISSEMVNTHLINILKGNYGEISTMAGDATAKVVGVDSVCGSSVPEKLVLEYAAKLKNVVAMSGPVDLISDGQRVLGVENGHPMMGLVTGLGCVATTVVAIFASAERDYLLATAGAMALVGVAGERAAKYAHTPAQFEVAFLGELYKITPSELSAECRVRQFN